jgi:ribosomal protein S6--L-glutamate ligase
MTPLRIGFLLPRYSSDSRSQMPRVMRILAEWGVVIDVIHPANRVLDLSNVRVEHDLYVLKKTSGLALSIAGALHAQGATIVNPHPVTAALRDKIVATRILQAAGVPAPATYVASTPGELAPLLDDGPLVIKPYQGACGFGVCVVRTAAELAAVQPPANKEPILAQRYHQPSGRDRKIYAIGDRLFGVKKVFPAVTEAEKHGEPFAPPPELRDIAHRCGAAFGIDLFGIDVIESDGVPYVVDMSSIPGFKGVPDAPLHLATYFFGAAQRAACGSGMFSDALAAGRTQGADAP